MSNEDKSEVTMCILKPDVAEDRLSMASVMMRLLAIDLIPIAMVRSQLTRADVDKLYTAHVGQPYYERHAEFMTSGAVAIIILDGEHAVARLREICGSTDPTKAQPGTLRAIFGSELPRNAIHASASVEEAKREIALFFAPEQESLHVVR